eukprot:TRINITY_DN105558_c2_g1_i1.p1 TRINITY_DN105558_c2_g1~~TRINITY_DN105558_c2_g1_i1.p1  ORF type:complete len:499 (+),score=61.62 TRINITY_DN105558_c2_g1_i1:197-1693(+)
MEESKSKESRIFSSILEAVGNTPMVRLNRIPQSEGLECEILVKCEFMNPTGSHKDRMALGIIEAAEKEGKIPKNSTIVEATSGNAGLAFSFVAAVKGYGAILCAIAKTSSEKVDLMRGFGADVIKARPGASSRGPDSVFAMAQSVMSKVPNTFYTTQFSNKANPDAHYRTTSQEVFDQCGGKLDYFFMSAGTGGTISGVGKRFKEILPKTKIIGCDPVGSLIGTPEGPYSSYKVEGVGYDFTPDNCDRSVVHEWYKFNDKDAFDYAAKLMREEGLMCGGSSGGNLWCAIQFAKKHKLTKEHRLVVVLPDTARNYLTKHVNKEWMLENNFLTEEEYRRVTMEDSLLPEKRLGDDLKLKDLDCKTLTLVRTDASIESAWKLLKQEGLLIANSTGLEKDEGYKGLVNSSDVLSAISTGKLTMKDKVENILKAEFKLFKEDMKVSTASKLLEAREYVLFKREADKKIYVVRPQDIMKKLTIHQLRGYLAYICVFCNDYSKIQ